MRRAAGRSCLGAVAVLCLLAAGLRAQDNPVKHTGDFSELEYYDPPNELQISAHLTGAEAVPQLGGLVLIRQMKLETFETNGRPKVIVEAPECLYDEINGTAKSAGPLKVRQADGQVEMEGVGFLWQSEAQLLNISNQVRTIIITGPTQKLPP